MNEALKTIIQYTFGFAVGIAASVLFQPNGAKSKRVPSPLELEFARNRIALLKNARRHFIDLAPSPEEKAQWAKRWDDCHKVEIELLTILIEAQS
jgi:hypothetical protein